MKSAMSTDKTMVSTPNESRIIDFSGDLISVAPRSLRTVILAKLSEEVRAGQLIKVNCLLEPYGLTVNPEFLKMRSGKLRIIQDIEIALNELDDKALLNELSACKMQVHTSHQGE